MAAEDTILQLQTEMSKSSHDSAEIPPPYQEASAERFEDTGDVAEDGRVNINVNTRLSRTLSLFVPNRDYSVAPTAVETQSLLSSTDPDGPSTTQIRLSIVIQAIGSRGDIQPFVALGNELQKHGHRVRIATHGNFETFVTSSGLEFFPIGGDPAGLMAYMVKNPGLIPSMKSLLAGDVQRKRKMMTEILQGCWKSCLSPDPKTGRPFVANAIIANPPSFGHVHCAEALGIPLHMMFTMPWTSTTMFAHPLAELKGLDDATDKEKLAFNWVSFAVVEWMTWQGLGDLVNDFRASLDLDLIPFSEGPLLTETLKIPFTYCWSPALVPKPADWPAHIDVCGFFFREMPVYKPPMDLSVFLRSGPKPVYIGFGSIVIDEPERLMRIILHAIKALGMRAIISKGWTNLGESRTSDETVFYVDDCPHEWLFQHVSAVVSHGGAGTAACGLRFSRPSFIIPFFGDQPFWGQMIAAAGAGPQPIPHSLLNTQNFTAGLRYCLSPEAAAAAASITERMAAEVGVTAAVRSFHRHLPWEELRCCLSEEEPAVWTYTENGVKMKLSNMAAQTLLEHRKVDPKKLKMNMSNPIMIEGNRWDPVTSIISTVFNISSGIVGSAVDIVAKPASAVREYAEQTATIEKTDIPAHPAIESLTEDPKPDHSNSIQHSAGCSEVQGRKRKMGAAMAMGTINGIGGVVHTAVKGYCIDIPLALADGMRNVPKLYGGKVRHHGQVTGWKSGLAVSGKSLLYGLGEGVFDVFYQPARGVINEGLIGGIKGLGKGAVGLGTKLTSGLVGVVAYPGLGFYKSIRRATHTKTRKSIVAARLHEAEYNSQRHSSSASDSQILEKFALRLES